MLSTHFFIYIFIYLFIYLSSSLDWFDHRLARLPHRLIKKKKENKKKEDVEENISHDETTYIDSIFLWIFHGILGRFADPQVTFSASRIKTHTSKDTMLEAASTLFDEQRSTDGQRGRQAGRQGVLLAVRQA